MSNSGVTHELGQPVMEDPDAALERVYLEEYLRSKGYTLHSVQDLPEEAARQLMVEASSYASARLAEVEKRAQLVREIHGISPPLS